MVVGNKKFQKLKKKYQLVVNINKELDKIQLEYIQNKNISSCYRTLRRKEEKIFLKGDS